MFKWIDGIFGTSLEVTRVITDDLKRLDAVKAGLGTQAALYVSDGKHETVLATLATHCKANELEVAKGYVQDKSPVLARRRLLARAHPYPFEQVQRYAEVLAIVGEPALGDAPGSRAVPKSIRALFAEAFRGLPDAPNRYPPRAEPLQDKGLVLEVARELVRRLGGTDVDLVDAIYTKGTTYFAAGGDLYRQVVDLRSLAAKRPDDVIAAAARMPATSRAELIRDLITWDLNTDARFLEFLVAQAGDSSKSAREAAVGALSGVDAVVLEPLAIQALGQGDAEHRAGMIDLLGRLKTPSALDALRTHRSRESTARIVAAIDTALSIAETNSIPVSSDDDARGYTAIDGQRIVVPALRPLIDTPSHTFGSADRDMLRAAIASTNERVRKQNEENERRGHKYRLPLIKESLADRAVAAFNGEPTDADRKDREFLHFYNWGAGAAWTRTALAKLPEARALAWAMALCGSAHSALSQFGHGPGAERVRDFLSGSDGDVRHLEAFDVSAKTEWRFGGWQNQKTREFQQGDLLRSAMLGGYAWGRTALGGHSSEAVWPYLAENIEIFDEAFGLRPETAVKLDRPSAIVLLTLLPATPARYFAPLLEAATGTTRAGRAEARALLGTHAEVEQRLIALLDDSRQAVRAGAAEWLAQRADSGAIPALWARLKKEKSELVRAAILTGLQRPGEDVSTVVGPDALIADAKKGMKSAKFDKLAWMSLDTLPSVRFCNGTTVPPDVLRWWIFNAYRLKQPGGNALFAIYLDQLDPADASAVSTWILDSWLNFDTARASELDANQLAKANAAARLAQYKRWIPDYTEERAFADLKAEIMGQYINSGADSKGVLALAVRAPSALAADRVRAYLKNHGSRTSQAQALLEMLIAIGDSVALQVVISAATRLKQKSVQAFANELIAKLAEARDWTIDELADRTIPPAGFDDDGVLRLRCGTDGNEYEGRLTSELAVMLRNPAGKAVSSLPSADDEASKASKKQLSTTKKELKQIGAIQAARLYEALCAGRRWPVADWLRFYHEHPVMRRLIERVVWMGLDAGGVVAGSFRPTAEGDFTNQKDESVDLAGLDTIQVAHGALLETAVASAWEQHLLDYEVKPLFVQFGRRLLAINTEQADHNEIIDRKGWLTDAFTVRGVATKLGYERGEALDGGYFNEYRKSFSSAGIAAVIEFTGNSLPEENVPASLIALRFFKTAARERVGHAARLRDIPPVLLSECWNDYHAIAAKGAYDPDWEKKHPW